MKATRIIQWNNRGKKVEAHIEVECTVFENVAYADGWNIPLGIEPRKKIKIKMLVNGKTVAESSRAPQVCKAAKEKGAHAHLSGAAFLMEPTYKDIMEALESAEREAGQDAEYKKALQEQNRKKAEQERKEAGKEEKKQAERAKKFAEALASGEKVALSVRMVGCNDCYHRLGYARRY